MIMQIKLVKYGIFLHSCRGSLTLVNKLSKTTASWANGLRYICIRGRGTQREYSSKPLINSIVKLILVFKQ